MDALENAVMSTGLSIELKGNESSPQCGHEAAINLTPEKITKDREWRQNRVNSTLDESIKEFRKTN